MAHTALHFAIGLAAGTALSGPAVLRALRNRRAAVPCAPSVTRMVAWSWTLGLWAIAPNVLRALGLPEAACAAWWMNVFLLHPAVDRLHAGGTLIGGALLVAVLAAQYGLILLAVALAGRRPSPATPSERQRPSSAGSHN